MQNEIRIVKIINDAQNIIGSFVKNSLKCTKHEDIKIDSLNKLEELFNFYENAVIRTCKSLDCKWSTVICYYIISRASYDKSLANKKLHLICQKSVYYMTSYGSNIFNSGEQNADLLKNIFSDIINLMTLNSIRVLYDFLPDKETLELKNNQIVFTPKQFDFFDEYNATMSGRGTRQRFSDTSTKFFLENRQEFINSLKNIVESNKKINEIKLFANTIYQYLPNYSEETAAFWNGLLNRVKFIDKLIMIILETILLTKYTAKECFELLFSFKMEEIDNIKDCILRKKSIKFNENATYSSPFVHIAPGFYATSFNIFGDSINAYIERNIYYNFDNNGQRVNWADEVCKSISREFEDRVIDIFVQNGFTVGEVTNKGAWKANNTLLINQNFEKIPGQIDALAVKNDKIYIIECKMYNDIYNTNRIKAINELFNVSYCKNIIDPLLKKVMFIKDSNIYIHTKLVEKDSVHIIPLIITDIPMPVFFSENSNIANELIITDFSSLNSFLKE